MIKSFISCVVLGVGVLLTGSSFASERMYLRAYQSKDAADLNFVALWKTAADVKYDRGVVFGLSDKASKALSCVEKPGAPVDVLKRMGSVALVQDRTYLVGGCQGFVNVKYLSAE